MIDEFVRLPAVWDRANRKLVHFNTFGSDCAKHRISEAAMRIMVFNGEHTPLRRPRAIQ